MKNKVIKCFTLSFYLLISLNSYASDVCLHFDLKPHRSDIISKSVINEFLFFKSSLSQDSGSILLFLDYSDRGDIEDKHAYIECTKSKTKMYMCESEEYDLVLDLENSTMPILHFNYLMVSDLDEEYSEVKTKSDQTLRIAGTRKSCKGLNRENQVLENE